MTAHVDVSAAKALFVQPHFDDIALSCGAAAAAAAAAGDNPIVVTLFSAAPSAAVWLSAAAHELHVALGSSAPAIVWQKRRAEDDEALGVLGAEGVRFDELDALYRGYEPATIMAGVVAPTDRALVQRLEDRLVALWRQTAEAVVYLPLAVGLHVDHVLAHDLGGAFARHGARIRYYEDFPYLAVGDLFEQRFRQLPEGLVPVLVPAEPWLATRMRAIEAYRSQLPRLFRDGGPLPGPCEPRIRKHAAAVNPAGPPCERFWALQALEWRRGS